MPLTSTRIQAGYLPHLLRSLLLEGTMLTPTSTIDSRFEADATQRADAPQDSAKMEFLEEIPEITNGWCERAQHWLKEYEAERDGETV